MKEKVLEILGNTRPEFDFKAEGVDFIEDGMLDSFDIVTLISDFEEQLGIFVPGSEVIPENFANVESIVMLLEKYK